MSPGRQLLLFSVLRVGIFALVFAVLSLLGWSPLGSALVAAIIGFCISYIFLRRPRDEVAKSIHQWRTTSSRDRDGDAEDGVLGDADDAAPRQH